MVARFVAALERPVSRVRLENYRLAGGSDLEMVVNYFYNLELAEALYPSLQAFEIALRNSIHATFTAHFRTPYWFDLPSFLPSRQTTNVADARASLSRANKLHDPDRIVAELHFGFWHSLFNAPFERRVWVPRQSALVLQVFPQIPGRQRSRQAVWDRCDRIRIIRNRVMHFEPIWQRPHLEQDHKDILTSLEWISREMHETIAMCDRFQHVFDDGRASIEQRILTEINRRYPAVPSYVAS